MNAMRLFALTVLLSSCAACAQTETFDQMLEDLLSHSVSEITPSELKTFQNPIILDARERQEFDVSHIPGAIFLGYDNFDISSAKYFSKNKTVVVYCSVGFRSEKIAEKLLNSGFFDVYNLRGGIFQWVNEGNPVLDKSGPTKNVHTYNEKWSKWLIKGKKQW